MQIMILMLLQGRQDVFCYKLGNSRGAFGIKEAERLVGEQDIDQTSHCQGKGWLKMISRPQVYLAKIRLEAALLSVTAFLTRTRISEICGLLRSQHSIRKKLDSFDFPGTIDMADNIWPMCYCKRRALLLAPSASHVSTSQ